MSRNELEMLDKIIEESNKANCGIFSKTSNENDQSVSEFLENIDWDISAELIIGQAKTYAHKCNWSSRELAKTIEYILETGDFYPL